MSVIDASLKLKYFDVIYTNPKTVSGGIIASNASAEGKDIVLSCYKKSDLIARETSAIVTTTISLVDGVEPEGNFTGEDDWNGILDSIDLTKCPYNKYDILLRKVVGETTTYDIFINIMDDVIAGDGYQISSANSEGEKTVQLFYDNVDTSEDRKVGSITGEEESITGEGPYVVLENKYLPFGSIVLNDNFGDLFTNEILIRREYVYETGEETTSVEFFDDIVSSSEADAVQTYSIGPDTIIVGGVETLSESVTELDSILTHYEQSYLQDDFLIFAFIRDSGTGNIGPIVGIENKIVYFNVPFSTSVVNGKVYVGSSSLLSEVPFTMEYDYSLSDPPITDFDEIIFNKAKIRFVEDGQEFVEYTGEDFSYLYEETENVYTFNAPYGIAPPSSPEGWTISGISPADMNGNFMKTDDIANDLPVYKHETLDYYIQLRDDNRIAIIYNGNSYFYTTTYYDETKGMDLTKYAWQSYSGGGTVGFVYIPEVKEEGEKTLSIVLYDEYGNHTDEAIPLVVILSISPESFAGLYLKLLGGNDSSDYTGFYYKGERLFPTDYITMLFYCESNLPLQYRITGDVSCSDTYYDFSGEEIKKRVVRLNVANENTSILNNERNLSATVQFKDTANNVISISKTIRYISKMHRFPVQNIRPNSESYYTQINRIEGNLTTEISQRRVSQSEYTRSWNDIFWPATHGYPLNDGVEIDEEEAIRISQLSIDGNGVNGPTVGELVTYDPLVLLTDGTGLLNDALQEDNEGRYNTIWNLNKKYSSMTNAYGSTDGTGLTYFIIDNAGYSDFRLEFEWFDFDSGVTKIPRNILSPYDGDVLVVYDASDPDAVEMVLDTYGRESYVLKDSTKLREIYAFTGSYVRDDIQMKNSGVDSIVKVGNGFVTPSITTTSRICLIPYTDSVGNGSGFKLRAGIKHNVEYQNYDLLNENGEIWIHESPETFNGDWRGADTINSSGQNYTTSSVVDYEKGIIAFSERQTLPVLANYTNYSYLNTDGTNGVPLEYFSNEPIVNYLSYNDDLVDYSDMIISVVPSGVTPDYDSLYDYLDVAKNFGKIVSGYTINKDIGLIEFTGAVPYGRLISSYYYHTYYRLTNDGYGDLYFYDTSLVPDSAILSYTDWTYVDLKLINEGTNTLTNGVLKFLTRGYVSADDTVDRVLNNNRPWDVQIGTDTETVNCTGAIVSTQKSTFALPSRSVAYAARSSQSAAFGTLLPKGVTYLRVYWCLSTNADGTAYVETTRGRKLYSAEMSGRYYTLTT